MHFPDTAEIHGALYGTWWCEPPDGVQKWNPKSSSYFKEFKLWKWLILDCSISGETPSIPYRYMYRNWDFKKIIGEIDWQKLWSYLAAFRCQTTKQIYKIIR